MHDPAYYAQGKDGVREYRIEWSGDPRPYEDTDLMALSGKTILTAEAAAHYGISDLPGYELKSLRAAYGGPYREYDLP